MGSIRVKEPRLRQIKGRFYWRPTPALRALGFSNTPLGEDLAAARDMAKRLNERARQAKQGKPAAPLAGSVAAVIRAYSADVAFTSKAPATRRGYKAILKEIEADFGDKSIADVTRPELIQLLREIQKRGLRIAKLHKALWSIILSFAQDMGYRADNPIARFRMKSPPSRTSVWTEDQIAALCAAAVTQQRPSIALAVKLAYHTGQRATDVLALPWSAIAGETITLRQSKTGQVMAVRMPPELRADLDAAPKVSPVIVINEKTVRPYKMTNFDHVFAEIRDKAKLPKDLWFRDLRRTALTEAGAGGASISQLQALGGHRTIGQLSAYVMPTDEASAEAQAMRNKSRGKVATVATKKDE